MIYFTSDHHFGHENIIRLCGRPFDSVKEMNDAMVERWNNVVADEDTVYVVGDFALGKISETLQYVGKLNGKKILIVGNHDGPFIANAERSASDQAKRERKSQQAERRYLDAGFHSIIHGIITMQMARTTVLVGHFSYFGANPQDVRYDEMKPVDTGLPLIHGHEHEKWKIKLGPGGGLMINIGVDVWDFTPVSITEIEKIIDELT